jgi:hypothetical protein
MVSKKRQFSISKLTLASMLMSLCTINGFSQNGVWVEAESITAAAPWKLETTVPQFWGNGYFYCDLNNDVGSGTGILSYEVNIPKDGLYDIAIRGLRNNLGKCATADQCNDIFIKVGSGSWTKKMVKMNTEDLADPTKWGGRWNEWVYDGTWGDVAEGQRPNLNLKAGKLSFQIGARSQKVHLDGFAFYLKGTTPPVAIGSTSLQKQPNLNTLKVHDKIEIFDTKGAYIKSIEKISLTEIKHHLENGLYILKAFHDYKFQGQQLQLVAR